MNGTAVIGEISESLQRLLRDRLRADPAFAAIEVDLRSPKELRDDAAPTPVVSFWLFKVSRMADRLNDPPVRIASGRLRPPPLPLRLEYLVTPLAATAITEHRLMGHILQAMADHAIVGAAHLPAAFVRDGVPTLSIHHEPQTLEELTRIWHALQEPYALSTAYAVHYVPLQALREEPEGPPVLVKTTHYADAALAGDV